MTIALKKTNSSITKNYARSMFLFYMKHKLKHLEDIKQEKMLRKQHEHNELNKYCRIVEHYIEIGFFKNEAIKYARYLIRK